MIERERLSACVSCRRRGEGFEQRTDLGHIKLNRRRCNSKYFESLGRPDSSAVMLVHCDIGVVS